MTYTDKLKDPRWQKRRLEIFQRDGFACVECNSKTETLHVHHRYYIGGRAPWEYPEFALVTLCAECHGFQKDHKDDKGENALFEWEIAANEFLCTKTSLELELAHYFHDLRRIHGLTKIGLLDSVINAVSDESFVNFIDPDVVLKERAGA